MAPDRELVVGVGSSKAKQGKTQSTNNGAILPGDGQSMSTAHYVDDTSS